MCPTLVLGSGCWVCECVGEKKILSFGMGKWQWENHAAGMSLNINNIFTVILMRCCGKTLRHHSHFGVIQRSAKALTKGADSLWHQRNFSLVNLRWRKDLISGNRHSTEPNRTLQFQTNCWMQCRLASRMNERSLFRLKCFFHLAYYLLCRTAVIHNISSL